MKSLFNHRTLGILPAAVFMASGVARAIRPIVPLDAGQASRPIAPTPVPPPKMSYLTVGDLLAARRILNDLLERSDYLDNEIGCLVADTDNMWNQWKTYVYPRSSEDPSTRIRSHKIRADLFRLRSRAQQLHLDILMLAQHLRDMEGGWNKVVEWALKYVEEGMDEVRWRGICKDLRLDLSKSALKINEIDLGVRILEADLDSAYTQEKLYFQQNLLEAPRMDPPSHWVYMFSDWPRPNLRYDMDSRYREYLEQSYQDLSGKKPQAR